MITVFNLNLITSQSTLTALTVITLFLAIIDKISEYYKIYKKKNIFIKIQI